MNAIGWDPQTGEMIDPYGGLADLDAKVLRHTTAAFAEDPLRVLRGVMFAGRLGFHLAPETVEECRSLHDAYESLPVERVWGEWSKIATKAPWPSKSLEALRQVGWEDHFPELAAVRDVPQENTWHPEGPVHVHSALAADAAAAIAERDGLDEEERTVVALAAMAHDFGKATHTQFHDDGRITSHGHAEAGGPLAWSFLARVGAPVRAQQHADALIREHMCAVHTREGEAPSKPAVRRLMRRLGSDGAEPSLAQWARVVEADNSGRGPGNRPSPASAWLRVAEELPHGRPEPSIVTGPDLIGRGMRPGPAFTVVLHDALAAQDAGEFADPDGAAAWLDGYLAGHDETSLTAEAEARRTARRAQQHEH